MRFPEIFTPTQAAVVANLHDRDSRERRQGIRTAESVKAVAPSVAQLLYLMVLQRTAKVIVEFGTSHGYSTIFLAAAAERTDGHVYTVDAMAEKTTWARANLDAAGLLHRVTLTTSDGADFAASLPDGIEFVLVDYGIAAFAAAFRLLRDRIAPLGTIFVDGGPDDYWESGAGADFRARLESDPAFLVSILPMHRDQLVALRIA